MWKREPKHRRALGTVFALVLLAPMASPALAGLPPTKVELFADARGFTVAGERGWLDDIDPTQAAMWAALVVAVAVLGGLAWRMLRSPGTE